MTRRIVHDLAQVLTHKGRMMTEEQVIREYGLSRRGILGLTESPIITRLIERTRILAAPLLRLKHPLHTWQPGEQAPSYGKLSYAGRSRTQRAFRPTYVYFATKTAARLVGGRGGAIRNPLQAWHDCQVTEVFLNLRRRSPAMADHWVGEDAIVNPGCLRRGRLPDAVLFDDEHRPVQAIEFVGHYSVEHIRRSHEFYSQINLPYEMW